MASNIPEQDCHASQRVVLLPPMTCKEGFKQGGSKQAHVARGEKY